MKIKALLDVVESTIDLPLTDAQKIILLRQLVENIKGNESLTLD